MLSSAPPRGRSWTAWTVLCICCLAAGTLLKGGRGKTTVVVVVVVVVCDRYQRETATRTRPAAAGAATGLEALRGAPAAVMLS